MTLEDIFSLTEMKDGFTAPSRVEELVSVMRKEKDKEKDCIVKNIGDATRHWTAVASTIAATEKRDCLDLFIQLDGLLFINSWLKEAQKFSNDTNESFIEESITAMLRALEKLHVDSEKSFSSGIWMTIKSLLDHNSSEVKDRAKALFDSWRQGRISDMVHDNVKSDGTCVDDGTASSSRPAEENSKEIYPSLDAYLPKGDVNKADNGVKPDGVETLPASPSLQARRAEDVHIQSHVDKLCENSDHADMKEKSSVLAASVSNSIEENSVTKEKSPIHSVEGTSSVDACVEGQADAQKMNDFSKDERQVQKVSSFPEKVCVTASASISSTVESRTVSSGADVASAHEIVKEPAIEKKCDSNKGNSQGLGIAVTNSKYIMPILKRTGEDVECDSHPMQNSYGNEDMYGKNEDLETSFSKIKANGAGDESKDHADDGASDSSNDSYFLKPSKASRPFSSSAKKTSDMELEYDIVDALEVACKVAQEVEREVVGYREPSCSSSDKISEGKTTEPDSSDSISGKQDVLSDVPPNEVPIAQNNSPHAHPEGDEHLMNSGKAGTEPGNGTADVESSQVTEAAQETEANIHTGFCGIDLNQEVCSDDLDRSANPVSTPVSVVSASRPAAATGFPETPLQFEGNLGWKGSAATSAFRPASPRRLSDCDKSTPALGETSNSSKQRQDSLDIDLNVAECGDDKVAIQMQGKHIAVSSGLHSAESLLEVSPRRLQRLNLDLNRVSDDSDPPPSDLRMEGRLGFFNRNGHHRSPSPASSSSSMQASLRNFDLNDRPHWQNDISDQALFHSKPLQDLGATIRSKPGDPVISIMGARVQLNRKDINSRVSSLPNGKSHDTVFDASMARTGAVLGLGPAVAYTHSPVFGYNGLATAPNLSYSSATYGPGGSIPYMMDSRGAPVVPQIAGSAPAAVPSSYSQAPFFLSMTGAPPGLMNDAGPSHRPSFDLNSGFPVEGGNRDSLGLRQLFMPNQGRTMEEHLRSQPSSSGIGAKRKEPDSGWEPYPFGFRHQQHPWK